MSMAKGKRRSPGWARFSVEEVAAATGRGKQRVWADARAGLIDPGDVRSVARYVMGLAPVSQTARASYLALGVALGIGKVEGGGEQGIPYVATVPTGSGGGGETNRGDAL